jgi:hypothetical protein
MEPKPRGMPRPGKRSLLQNAQKRQIVRSYQGKNTVETQKTRHQCRMPAIIHCDSLVNKFWTKPACCFPISAQHGIASAKTQVVGQHSAGCTVRYATPRWEGRERTLQAVSIPIGWLTQSARMAGGCPLRPFFTIMEPGLLVVRRGSGVWINVSSVLELPIEQSCQAFIVPARVDVCSARVEGLLHH